MVRDQCDDQLIDGLQKLLSEPAPHEPELVLLDKIVRVGNL